MKTIVTHPITGEKVSSFEICTNETNMRFWSIDRGILTFSLKKWPSRQLLKMLEDTEADPTARVIHPSVHIKAVILCSGVVFQFQLFYEVKTPIGNAKYTLEEKCVCYEIESSKEEAERLVGSQLWRLEEETAASTIEYARIKAYYNNYVNPLNLRDCFKFIKTKDEKRQAVALLRTAFGF